MSLRRQARTLEAALPYKLMAAELIGKYLIVSRADYKSEENAWLPYVLVMWNDEDEEWHFYSRHFENIGRAFETQKGAENFGLTVARAWITDKL